jgi:hypothetical protein
LLSVAAAVATAASLLVPPPPRAPAQYYKNISEYKEASSAIQAKAHTLLQAAASNLTRPVPAAAAAAAAAAAGGDDVDDEAVFERLTSLLDDTYERLNDALDASKVGGCVCQGYLMVQWSAHVGLGQGGLSSSRLSW